MLSFDSIDEVKIKMSLFENLYTGIRLVEPAEKRVACIVHMQLELLPFLCYPFWESGTFCENCVSLRASREKRMLMKIGGNNNGLFMVSSVPVRIGEKSFVLEMVQDVTGRLCLDGGVSCENPQMLLESVTRHVDRLITTDDLTGLYNRRFMDENLSNALVKAFQTGRPCSALYVDVDFFKEINDTYGHQAGDYVLKGVAGLLRDNTRVKEGWAARYGGDEFLIFLPDVDNGAARKIAERLRVKVMNKVFRIGGGKVHLTCSFGVQTYETKAGQVTAQAFLSMADEKLYQAKSRGRNRVV